MQSAPHLIHASCDVDFVHVLESERGSETSAISIVYDMSTGDVN